MNFGQAVEALKQGKKVTRAGWNGKGMFLFLVPSSTFAVNRPPLLGIYPEGTVINYQAHIDMKTADNKIVPWLASQSDVLGEDWQEYELPVYENPDYEPCKYCNPTGVFKYSPHKDCMCQGAGYLRKLA